MNRFDEAYIEADTIMQKLFANGFDIHNPFSIGEIGVWNIGLNYGCGASRIVVWDDNLDYVVKIPIGYGDERYCVHEVELYEKAVECGLASHFAWCDCLGEYDGRNVYVMERLDCNENMFEDLTYTWRYESYCEEKNLDPDDERSRQKYSHYFWDFYCDDDLVLEWFLSQFSEKISSQVRAFINRWQINDIHAGNMGYRGSQPVLCDYAGFGWSC